jgi:tRNA pseudouridine55 synthase
VYGLINFHKAKGWTSHDCVAKLRRLLQHKRIGHGGTLDPAATGVLPIALGQATRLLPYLPTGKAYQARIRLGITTTTDDLEGEMLTQQDASQVMREAVVEALMKFVGTLHQTPPRYSAIQVEGQRLYDRARRGEIFDVPVREVQVDAIQILNWTPGTKTSLPEVEVAIACGPGTYIRSIARDLGLALGVGGTLASLIRTRSCGLELGDSLTLESIAAQIEQDSFVPLDPATVLAHLPSLRLTPELVHRWRFGQRLPMDQATSTQPIRVEDELGIFLGIGELRSHEDTTILAPKLVLQAEIHNRG